jgi:hypothetical protein
MPNTSNPAGQATTTSVGDSRQPGKTEGSEFSRFAELTQQLVSVPKKEIEEAESARKKQSV